MEATEIIYQVDQQYNSRLYENSEEQWVIDYLGHIYIIWDLTHSQDCPCFKCPCLKR